jgi:ribA/ribD-fused uncharacterized protein
MTEAILGFRGKYRWLSNFVDCPVTFEDVMYPSTENAYQAAKTLDLEERRQFETLSASEAKKAGQKVKKRTDWEQASLYIMTHILLKKFTQPQFEEKLLATGDAYIEETNHWGDTFWGVCDGVGENHLGQIIMKIRSYLRSDIYKELGLNS